MPDGDNLHMILDRARRELLDLTSRNRLVNTPRGTGCSSVEVIDELSVEVFRLLVTNKRKMQFVPIAEEAGQEQLGGIEDHDAADLFAQLDGEETSDSPLAARHTDDKLQTPYASEQLHRKLLKLSYDARTYEEEQGVNILFLALGFLKWYEDDRSDRARYAPLILVPVSLERSSATAKFKIRYTEDDLATNLSLQARLEQDFAIKLPDLPELDDLDPQAYFDQVQQAIPGRPRWEVAQNDIVLWFFSFSKFLMYRDLDPATWPEGRELDKHPLIRGVLREGFAADPPLCADGECIDPLIPASEMVHVLDADSSQAIVIEEVKRGRNLVIQGPPGTGKSQTITNLIAAAVHAGKKVLFVAEKMAALEVVERRLAKIGLGDMCLDLHSHKANKRSVLDELKRTLSLEKPWVEDVHQHAQELDWCRERLNEYLRRIHTPLAPSGFTPYQIVGELVRLRAAQTRLPQFRLVGALDWTRAEFERRLNLLRDLVQHAERLGTPGEHPWRGVELDAILPTDIERLTAQVPLICERLNRLHAAGAQLAECLGVASPEGLLGISVLAQMAARFLAAPSMDRAALAHVVWTEQRQLIAALVEKGQLLAELESKLQGVIVDVAWGTDVTASRRNLAAYGRSWFRLFVREYRDAQAMLRGILVGTPPKPLELRLAILDDLIRAQNLRAEIAANNELGSQAFGNLWWGDRSDWQALAAIVRWEADCHAESLASEFRQIFARLHDVAALRQPMDTIQADLRLAAEELRALFSTIKLDSQAAFGVADPLRIPVQELVARLQQWQQQPETLYHWMSYHARQRRLAAEGLADLMRLLDAGEFSISEAVAQFELAYFEELIRSVFANDPELAAFDGTSHEQLLERFRRLDLARIDIARHEVALAHFNGLPSDLGALGDEFEKRRRHLPIRRLLSRSGRTIQQIKPVFMMSPVSVAQFLAPGAIEFDMLLIDEASQVQPVDALGAIARAKQIVVVGDSKQLPPTTFFQRMLDDDGDGEDSEAETINAGDMESILRLCCAQGVPQRMLNWHYRSRHHSLIAVSNHEFYDDRLFVVPSPGNASTAQGLVLRYIPDGVFDRGRSATNRVEAKAVAEAVMEHARNRPGKSLGVGTFSVAQRDAILDELELLRRANPSLETFFATTTEEPFFVKNLENIQGDERDVILISVGYGKDESGYMAMNFGPLSNDGGERRLNVLITRARECCVVFSSIRSDDIDLNRTKAKGTRALKAFLKYAETGLLDTGMESAGDHGSEFERQVAKALAKAGYETHPQVGVAGFYIDLAVVDPDQPGRYLIGIECDGANYHRARWARDRDRLRQNVLEDRGWIIHRIWSTDWFQRPDEELRKAVEAIEQAKIAWAGRDNGNEDSPPILPMERSPINRVDGSGSERHMATIQTVPYRVCSVRISSSRGIHELPRGELAAVIARIINEEGPIHREEIARRVAQLWGQRAGSRIRARVDTVLNEFSLNGQCVRERDFFAPSNLSKPPVRNRSNVEPRLRRPELLPPAEIREAMLAVVQLHVGASRADAVSETARLLGCGRITAQIREVIEEQVQWLREQNQLDERNGMLYVVGGCGNSSAYAN